MDALHITRGGEVGDRLLVLSDGDVRPPARIVTRQTSIASTVEIRIQ